MGILLSLLLIALGLYGAEGLVSEKIPTTRDYYAKTIKYRETVGLIGLIWGAVCLVEWLTFIPHFNIKAFYLLLSLISTVLTLGLGLIFGLDFIRSNLKNPSLPLLVKLDVVRTKIYPFQQVLGVTAIIVGAFYFLENL